MVRFSQCLAAARWLAICAALGELALGNTHAQSSPTPMLSTGLPTNFPTGFPAGFPTLLPIDIDGRQLMGKASPSFQTDMSNPQDNKDGYGTGVKDEKVDDDKKGDKSHLLPEGWNLHAQTTIIPIFQPGFGAPYSGPNSLSPAAQRTGTISADLFLGAPL